MVKQSRAFTIKIAGSPGRYTIEAAGPGNTRVVPQPFTLKLNSQQRATMHELARGEARISTEELRDLGHALYEAVFVRSSIESEFERAKLKANKKDPIGLRLEVEPAELTLLPWEAMYDGQEFISARSESPLVRTLPARDGTKLSQIQVHGPLRILFVGASPQGSGLGPLDAEQSADDLRKKLAKAIKENRIVFDTLVNATWGELQRELRKDYHILYFAGHGSPEGILLDDGQGEDDPRTGKRASGDKYPVSAERLGGALKGKQQTRLVFLAACNTATSPDSKNGLLASFAQVLVAKANLPAIVAMQYKLDDIPAGWMAAHFFDALANSRSVDVALAEARMALLRLRRIPAQDVVSPVMYLQAEDGQLFPRKRNWPTISAIVLASVVTLAVILLLLLRLETRDRRVQAQQLAERSQTLLSQHPQQSLLLAIEAVKTTLQAGEPGVPMAEQALRDALANTGGLALARHQGSVSTLGISLDNHWLAAGGEDGTVYLWDLSTSFPSIGPLKLAGHRGRISKTVFSPDMHWLITGSADGTARLWDLTATDPSKQPLVLGDNGTDNGGILDLAISPNNQWLVTGNADSTARLWDLTAADPATKSIVLAGHEDEVGNTAISPNGHWLVTASWYGPARLWDLMQDDPSIGSTVFTNIHGAAFSPDDRWLIMGSGLLTASITLQDLSDPSSSPVVIPYEGYTSSPVVVSQDSRWLVTSGLTEDYLWDLRDPFDGPIPLAGDGTPVLDVAISSDSRWLVTGNWEKAIRLWDLNKPIAEPVVLKHEAKVPHVAISPNDQWLISGSEDGTVRIWDLTSDYLGTPIAALKGHEGAVTALAISPDSQRLITGGSDGFVRLWDLTADYLGIESLVLERREFPISTVSISPDNHWLVVGGGWEKAINSGTGPVDGSMDLHAWNLQELGTAPVALANRSPICATSFSADSRWLAAGGFEPFSGSPSGSSVVISSGSPAFLWDMTNTSGQPLVFIDDDTVNTVAITPDNHWLVTGSRAWNAPGEWDGTVSLWSLTDTNAEPIALTGHNDSVFDIAISPDNRWLVSGSWDGGVLLRQLSDLNSAPITLTHEGAAYAVAISPDNHWLAVGSEDSFVRLWNLETGIPPAEPTLLSGHEGAVFDVAFSADSQSFITGSKDKTVRIWDLNDLAAQPIVLHDKAMVYAVAVSPDNHWLVTGNADGTARLWNLRLEELIEVACRTAGRNLTASEWQQYMGNTSYRKTCEQWILDAQ